MSEQPIKSKLFTAKQLGWMRRKDKHPNAWELPCGCIYVHWDSTEPHAVVAEISIDEPKDVS